MEKERGKLGNHEIERQALLDRLRNLDQEKQAVLTQLKELAEAASDSAPLPPLLGEPARTVVPKSPQEKIAFFLEMFRCREDLYAKRWENTSKGIAGYVPAIKSA